MERILIIGSPGAGKSTLARRIAGITGLPLIHLDREYWRPGWIEPPQDVWAARAAELAQRPRWIMDGNYSSTMASRAARATTVVLLDVPRWLCLLRVLNRALRHRGTIRQDMAESCPERLEWAFLRFVWTYPARSRRKALTIIEGLRSDQRGIVLRTNREIAAFEASLHTESRAA